MKLVGSRVFFLVFAIMMISINCRIQTNKVKKKNTGKKADEKYNNKFSALVHTIIKRLKGDDREVQYNQCLPATWKDGTDKIIGESAPTLLLEFLTKFDKVFPDLNEKLDKPCEIKEKVKEVISKNPPLTFLQLNLKSKRNLKKSEKVRKVKRYEPFDDIMKKHGFVMNNALNHFFKSEFWAQLRVVIQCFQASDKSSTEFKDKITKFIENIGRLGNTEGFIDVAVNALCNWNTFKQALTNLGHVKLEKDEIKKWIKIGEFMVGIIETFYKR